MNVNYTNVYGRSSESSSTKCHGPSVHGVHMVTNFTLMPKFGYEMRMLNSALRQHALMQAYFGLV